MIGSFPESAKPASNLVAANQTLHRSRNRRLCQVVERCARAFVSSEGDTVQGDLEGMLFLVAEAMGAVDAMLLISSPVISWQSRVDVVVSQQPVDVLNRLADFSLDSLMQSGEALSDIYQCRAPQSGQDISVWQYLLGGMPGLVLPLVSHGSPRAVMAFAFEKDELVLSSEGRSALLTLAHMAVVFADVGVLDTLLQCQVRVAEDIERLSGVGSWEFHPATNLLRVSPQLKQLFGLLDGEAVRLPYLARRIHQDDRQRVLATVTESLRQGEGYQLECRIVLPTGRQRRVYVRAEVERQQNGEIWRYGLVQDIGSTNRLESTLPLYHRIVEQMEEGVLVLSCSGTVESVNPAFCRMTGYSAATLAGKQLQSLHRAQHPPAFYRNILVSSCRTGSWVGEIDHRLASGDVVAHLVRVTTIRREDESVRYLVIMLQGATSGRQLSLSTEWLANRDVLTGLPNRNLAIQRIETAITTADAPKQVGVVVINIDDFKPINDSLGHVYGDELLKAFGLRLIRCGLGSENVARLGGDEFCVLIPHLTSQDDALQVVTRIRQLEQQSYDLDAGFEVYVSVCMGVAIYPQHGDSALQLLNNADTALHEAKRAGRDSVCYYHNDMTLAAASRLELISQLRVALQNGSGLRLFYQPQVDAITGQLVGLEALIRWQHPADGLLLPDRFLGSAHDAGLMPDIDRFTLQQTARQIFHWRSKGLLVVPVAVNISQQSFVAGNLLEQLQSLVGLFGLQPGDIELELTEGALLEPTPQVLTLISAINDLGIGLVIDDFGTGYSSLGYLHRFPLQKLKIDRSFVSGVEDAGDSQVITRTIVKMAQELGFGLVAEGVENARQADFLSRSGCVVHQGFWYDQALEPESVEGMLQALPSESLPE